MKYDFAAIESKWQKKWEETKPYAAVTGDPRPKFYGLIEFPYPSAAGLHVGHPRPFTAMDIICRKKRMQGYNVLNPIGFDAFGLPTENFAIKNHDFQREGVVTHMRDEYSTFGWVIERMLTDVGFTLEAIDYHAPLHGTYLLRKPKAGEQS